MPDTTIAGIWSRPFTRTLISLLPPPGIDVTTFFMENRENDPNMYKFFGEFIISHCMSCKISSPKREPLEDSKTKVDQLLDEVLGEIGPMDSRDEGDQPALKVELMGLKDEGDQLALEEENWLIFILFMHFYLSMVVFL